MVHGLFSHWQHSASAKENINRPEPECKTYVFGKTLVLTNTSLPSLCDIKAMLCGMVALGRGATARNVPGRLMPLHNNTTHHAIVELLSKTGSAKVFSGCNLVCTKFYHILQSFTLSGTKIYQIPAYLLQVFFSPTLLPPNPTNGWATNPPIHSWRIPSSKGKHLHTPTSNNKHILSACMATPPLPPLHLGKECQNKKLPLYDHRRASYVG